MVEPDMLKTMALNREKALKELQDAIDKITAKEVFNLTKQDKAFLKARISYLKPAEKEKFKSILEPKVEKEEKK